MRAVILAGGRGTRLAPYTTVLPKPLLPVGDRPVLELIVRQLARSDVKVIDLCVGHLGELIRAYFSENSHLPPEIELRYHWEERPLGTVGALRQIHDLDQTFLLVNGDVLATLEYADLIRFHGERQAALTMAVRPREIEMELGVVETDGRRATGFHEKPKIQLTASTGINVCEPSILRHLPQDGAVPFDFPDLVQKLIAGGEQVLTYPLEGRWFDIGTFGEYEKAQAEVERHPELFGD
jgi:NDP-sugar pyrophosphorylase family protein